MNRSRSKALSFATRIFLNSLARSAFYALCAKVGRDSRFQRFGDAVKSLQRALDHLPAKIELDVTRAMAQPKIAALRDFLAAVEAESYNEL